MVTIAAAQEPRILFTQPHEIVTFIDSIQREFPDAPRSRIAEALFECRRNTAAVASREALKDTIRGNLTARKYASGPATLPTERVTVNPTAAPFRRHDMFLTA